MDPRNLAAVTLLSVVIWIALASVFCPPVAFMQATPPAMPTPPPAPTPCFDQTGSGCRMVYVPMIVGQLPRAFTAEELGDLSTLDGSSTCQGRLIRGSIRYFVNGTAPSAVVGTLVPPAPGTAEELRDPTGTLELEGDVIILYAGELIRGFKTIAATQGEAEISWDCQL